MKKLEKRSRKLRRFQFISTKKREPEVHLFGKKKIDKLIDCIQNCFIHVKNRHGLQVQKSQSHRECILYTR